MVKVKGDGVVSKGMVIPSISIESARELQAAKDKSPGPKTPLEEKE